ncbi:MAG: nitrogen regulation protein NR(I) [Alphaproteobacteria bacterium HGW-Alphaproteobacteria-1]|jgi:two-component system nitrogen regulation response regulator GlnG|nr:MAG: nitrogen regulation protein NR(I) [Alphaproteobacteria bacterium HGW-Alphaproteobacteria-1]
MDGTVLVADDDRTIRTVLTQALTRAGCKVHATSSLTTLMRWVAEGRGDVVISDVMMPDGNGLEMLPKIAQDRPGLPVIVISAQNTIMTAIKAAEAEAFDYLPKPFDLPDLMKRTARALAARERKTAREAPEERPENLPLIGRSAAMQALYKVVAQVMHADLPVMICGESGTGKSLVARAVHDYSDRRSLPFVTVTGTDLHDIDGPAQVMARVRGGTLVLDEVSDLSPEIQGRVVRMMEAPGESAPRFMATSRVPPAQALEAGALREDFYYRLSGVVIDVPALRDRIEDIPILATHFLAREDRPGMPERRLSEEAVELMRAYGWPGNVRQLENAMRRLALTAQAEVIGRAEIAAVIGTQPKAEPVMRPGRGETLSGSVGAHLQRYFDLHGGELPPSGLHARILREVEGPLIEIALEATGGNQIRCAELLGINRNTLRKKMTDLDIRVTRRRKLM